MNSFCTNVVKQAARFYYYYYDFLFFLYFYCSFRLAPPTPPPPKKNTFSRAADFFVHFFAVVLHDYGVKLPSYTFYRGIVVCVPVRIFFYCCSVSPLWPLAFLIFSHPIRYENFHLFLPTKYVSFAFYLSIYLFPCYPSLTWFSRKKKTRLVVQLPIHPHMDDVYNWQVIIIFHVHKLLPCLSIVSSKYDI